MKEAVKTAAFLVILAVLYTGISALVRPAEYAWNVHNSINGFYSQPDNTLNTVTVGASTVMLGVAPMDMYEDYGICAYNLNQPSCPPMMAYYWLLEAYDHHSETLKNVVFDVSCLRAVSPYEFYLQSESLMKLSKNKYHAIRDMSGSLEEFVVLFSPMYYYHNRWKSLKKADISPAERNTVTSNRGYCYTNDCIFMNEPARYDTNMLLRYEADPSAKQTDFSTESLYYLQQVIGFCNEHGLNLVFIKTPKGWSDGQHNAVKDIADSNGIVFLDFCFAPYAPEININAIADYRDGGHLDYRGAKEITAVLGRYLSENTDAPDVRGQEKYAFMDRELEMFRMTRMLTETGGITDPAEYISAVNGNGSYTVFITSAGGFGELMSGEQRDAFSAMGLKKLSVLGEGQAYQAMMIGGRAVYEEVTVTDQGGLYSAEEACSARFSEDEPRTLLEYSGYTGGKPFSLRSGTDGGAAVSSLVIDNREYSPAGAGLNIIVYDDILARGVSDSVTFGTRDSLFVNRAMYQRDPQAYLDMYIADGRDPAALSGPLRELYLYNIRQEEDKKAYYLEKNIAETGISGYIKEYMSDRYYIFLTAGAGAWEVLSESDRSALVELGFTELAMLCEGDCLAASAAGGSVYEVRKENDTAEIVFPIGEIMSLPPSELADTADNSSSDDENPVKKNTGRAVMNIGGKKYNFGGSDIGIAVYDTVTGLTVDTVTLSAPAEDSEGVN